ncbi:MAG: fatty acid desaturase family protein [Acidimicrobiales bacterium]
MDDTLRMKLDSGPSQFDLARTEQMIVLRRAMRSAGLTVGARYKGQFVLFVCALSYGGLALAAELADHNIAWLAVWPIMSFLILSIAAGVHETVHNHIFQRATSRRAFQALSSLLLLIPIGVYPAYHLSHHVYLDSAQDPEGVHRIRNRFEYLLGIFLSGPAFVGQLWWGGLRSWTPTPCQYMRSGDHVRKARADSLVAFAGLLVVSVGSFKSHTVFQVWLVPLALFLTVGIFFFLAPEHLDESNNSVAGLPASDAARTTTTNRFVRFVGMGFNYHGVHHAWPEVPGSQLGRADALFARLQPDQWRSSGYLVWHLKAFRRLCWFR